MILQESEIQLLTIINLASYKYKNQIVTKNILLKLGKYTMSEYLLNWDEAYDSLIEKDLIFQDTKKDFTLTGKGIKEVKEIKKNKPYWLYKYNSYFLKSQSSIAHKKFCKEVYGDSFSQHGMADKEQIDAMISVLKNQNNERILELGCGNGLISEVIQKETHTNLTAIDLSDVAIDYAKKYIKSTEQLSFEIGNMNCLNYKDNSFDGIIAIDTLYFVENLEKTIEQCLNILKPDGKFAIFYTQWSAKDKEETCKPRNTDLAKIFNENKIKYDFKEFSENEKKHWKKKIEVLEKLEPEFEQEGNQELYEFRYEKASRVVKQNESGNIISRRYLYFN